MQEVLAKPGYEKLPLSEQEFYELCLDESEDTWGRSFVVRQAHVEWSEIDRQFMFDDFQSERFADLQRAKRRYEAWRQALVDKGFSPSDMEF